jgi:acetyltransferase-like isoleucine patch superfamily enzyme
VVHQTAIVSSKAKIGKNVSIGAFSIIHDNVEIGDNAVIDNYCEIGYPTKLAEGLPLVIGIGALIRSHSIFYQGSVFGENLVTGHRVTVREKVNAGKNLQIGTLSDFQGDCEIGDYVRAHSNVHIGKGSIIGNFVWIFPYVVLTNDPHPPSTYQMGVIVEDYAVIATMSVILPGVTIGEHSLIAAHSLVKKDVPPHTVASGSPAKNVCSTSVIRLKDGTNQKAYPWPRHFHRGYPEAVVNDWLNTYT